MEKLKEEIRLILLAFKLVDLTDFISDDETDLYREESDLNVSDIDKIQSKFEGWGEDSLSDELKLKTKKLIDIL